MLYACKFVFVVIYVHMYIRIHIHVIADFAAPLSPLVALAACLCSAEWQLAIRDTHRRCTVCVWYTYTKGTRAYIHAQGTDPIVALGA